MRIATLLIALLFGTSFASLSQKYGYIDSDYIMSNMPEYEEAKKELDKYAERWQKEIEVLYKQIDKRRNEFNRVEAILPKEEQKRRKKEIEELVDKARATQEMRFGIEGDLFQKRKELIEPIQDKVFEALGKVASKRNFAFIFDKANQSNLIFADPKFDISDMVLREIGINKE